MEKAGNSDEIIKVNVGGSRKEISAKLLTSVSNSLLEQTFSGRYDLMKVDGYIFLDRDPIIFDMMLNYLRYKGDYFPSNANGETFKLFEMELRHWDLLPSDLEETPQHRVPEKLTSFLKEEPFSAPRSEKE